MSSYLVMKTTWGGFLVHSSGCPIIARDDTQHCGGNTDTPEVQIDVLDPTSKYDLAEQVRDALEYDQPLNLFSKRFIYHSLTVDRKNVCEAEYLK